MIKKIRGHEMETGPAHFDSSVRMSSMGRLGGFMALSLR